MKEAHEEVVRIPFGEVHLEGSLSIPQDTHSIVLFAHGSGSSRFSPRNQFVAKFLGKQRLATFLIDLLTAEEEKIDQLDHSLRFNIDFLAERLIGVTDWLLKDTRTKNFKIGCFGSSTGAAGALIAAAKREKAIQAVVSRGGRPDLALPYLHLVRAPTLLIAGGFDAEVIQLNKKALELLACPKELSIVPEATHLFEEPGALEEVAKLASGWFLHYLGKS